MPPSGYLPAIVPEIWIEGGLRLIPFHSKRQVLHNAGTIDLPSRVSLGRKYRLIFYVVSHKSVAIKCDKSNL